MLQVGRLGCSSRTSGCPVPSQYAAWTRTHFAAFCIVSSPLVLSIYPSDENLAPILDIIGNKEAMAVNQAWAGHPGTLVRTIPPANIFESGAPTATLPPDTKCRVGQMPGGDIFSANMTVVEGVEWCSEFSLLTRGSVHFAFALCTARPFCLSSSAYTSAKQLHF